MLDGRLAEMATGEGKTLAAGLARGRRALAGVPVHVLTANDYLVQRDRDELAPLYDALGLASACVLPSMSRAAARAPPTAATSSTSRAKELAFDYLRDHLLLRGERDPRLLRARCAIGDADPAALDASSPRRCRACASALIDEADSILLDEACSAADPVGAGAPIDEVPAYRRALEHRPRAAARARLPARPAAPRRCR